MSRRLDCLTFRVPNAPACQSFYETVLGMSKKNGSSSPNNAKVLLGYNHPKGMKLSFHESPSCTVRKSTSQDAYWKIGITVKNLDHAVGFLQLQGVPVSQPAQFLDIGYLCHLRDPAGMAIELLQQGFEGDEEQPVNDDDADEEQHPIGCQAILAHITVRSTNKQMQQWCQETMGMRLMSVQPVKPYNFTLYFYTWSHEVLPESDDLEAVKNRPWLWARPYGLLEIQQKDSDQQLRATGANEAGPTEITIVEEDPSSGDKVIATIDCLQDLGL
ncbi:glyoxalase bleomycin resistance protein dioxygenase [Seminavis robusta]|uniref:Glyoxalase bleomycin resistance protein dioxygenase n=1 Tax=Seminavis robusta TaxID=568900 RepID=A0A9N8EC77_9STRA|nr:glyoxalase bleomycin resistance protein dioxygenase [Seminavis robusta]|eukprot:Sro959_g224820.1 glyoxalase bleomycin resistance protein dioxygenase (273) ;mRNA; r:36061-36879